MADATGPFIVRRRPSPYYAKPGIHSHNAKRRFASRSKVLLRTRALLLLIGLCGLGYYGYETFDAYVYQAYQNWAFDQHIAGKRGVSFADYLREQTPFGFFVGVKSSESSAATVTPSTPAPSEAPRPAQGSLLGRLVVDRLNLVAMVREGVDANTLKVAVGHVPSSALPDEPGNFAIAAHRDTLFRALKGIKKNDLVTFQSSTGNYTYEVLATKIVKPSDVTVLRPDGGGLIPSAVISSDHGAAGKLLTMITCYPFYYVGSAPKRFIVEAKLVSSAAALNSTAEQGKGSGPPVS